MINPSLGCLVASVSVASSPVTSDEIETISIEIVENSLELFNTILTTIRQSTRAGGHVLQNYIMMGAWVLTSGLLVQLASAMETSPTTTKPRLPLADLMSHGLNLNKVQQRLVLRFNNRWRWRRGRFNFRQNAVIGLSEVTFQLECSVLDLIIIIFGNVNLEKSFILMIGPY